MRKNIRTRWIIAILIAMSLLFFTMLRVYYVPKTELDIIALRADSLLSANLSLEKELQKSLELQNKMKEDNKRLLNKLYILKLRPGNHSTMKSVNLKKKLDEMADMIRIYQSQMRSLISANEELEKQVQELHEELP